MSTSQENDDFLYIIHHVFLPPRLPQQDDLTTSSDQALMGAVLDAMERFKRYITQEDTAVFQSALDMVRSLSSTRPGKRLDRYNVDKAICDLADGGEQIYPFYNSTGPNRSLPIYITCYFTLAEVIIFSLYHYRLSYDAIAL